MKSTAEKSRNTSIYSIRLTAIPNCQPYGMIDWNWKYSMGLDVCLEIPCMFQINTLLQSIHPIVHTWSASKWCDHFLPRNLIRWCLSLWKYFVMNVNIFCVWKSWKYLSKRTRVLMVILKPIHTDKIVGRSIAGPVLCLSTRRIAKAFYLCLCSLTRSPTHRHTDAGKQLITDRTNCRVESHQVHCRQFNLFDT